jgi:hypothetical protein
VGAVWLCCSTDWRRTAHPPLSLDKKFWPMNWGELHLASKTGVQQAIPRGVRNIGPKRGAGTVPCSELCHASASRAPSSNPCAPVQECGPAPPAIAPPTGYQCSAHAPPHPPPPPVPCRRSGVVVTPRPPSLPTGGAVHCGTRMAATAASTSHPLPPPAASQPPPQLLQQHPQPRHRRRGGQASWRCVPTTARRCSSSPCVQRTPERRLSLSYVPDCADMHGLVLPSPRWRARRTPWRRA